MKGAADILVTIILAGFVFWGGYRVLMWLADRLIDAIEWMTRNE